jgi:ATP-dependent Lhr-like helicase
MDALVPGTDSLDTFHPAVADWFRRAFPHGATQTQARAWAVTSRGGHALVSAPTGSGKTLAAFMAAIDDLVVRGSRAPLPDCVQVLYVSPLKALSNDIDKNLQAPLCGIRDRLFELGLPDVGIRTAVRTGDTTQSERALMRKLPPHILVTTPESLFILLGSESGRTMLAGVRSVIVDELHAVAGSKRGAHLMLTLERLGALCARPPVRIGLSATVKPIEAMADYLVGAGASADTSNGSAASGDALAGGCDVRSTGLDGIGAPIPRPACTIIDAGHVRQRDIALEVPSSPLDAVMANEVWGEVYDRLADLVAQHRTTLIFVNQRRIAERVARHLAERIGDEYVTAHHGSLAKEHRFMAEQRLKAGQLKVLVATSSLELGIDIGDVDLVCQLGSPRWIAAFLQRVGRAGHAIGAIPKGRLFPLTLDDLLECSALLDAVRRGELDRIRDIGMPLDVLAQQILAEVGSGEWDEDELFATLRRAAPYRDLARKDFDDIVRMLSEGYATRRGRRGAYLHHDTVNRRLRPRRGTRLTAATNAGVIPDQFDSDVVLMPEGHRIGTLNEDFAFESIPGDIFQLGNTAYRIAKIETGKVYVEDAKGQPPTLPFWFGEALGRSDELSFSVSRLVATIDDHLDRHGFESATTTSTIPPSIAAVGRQSLADALLGESPATRHRSGHPTNNADPIAENPCNADDAIPSDQIASPDLPDRTADLGLPAAAWQQLLHYLATAKAALGTLPTLDTIVMERFFDDVGDTHLVIHSPHGSRINKAWGLALRKRFCRQFNFELQASALEDSIVLSLGPSHSFPLEDVQKFLKAATAREVLVQALLDAPMFPTRWRWNASIALAVRRMNGGKRVPPQFQRSDAEDLLTVIFPDQVACAENLVGEREIPDHPLVAQTLHDCLHDTMDLDGFLALLSRIESGAVRVICRDLAAPSPLSNAILNARPYAFLDDGEAEERRTRSVTTQRLVDIETATGIAQIDPDAIAKVRGEVWPLVRDADELHDALVVHGFLSEAEVDRLGARWLGPLFAERRAARATLVSGQCLVVAAERLPEIAAALGEVELSPSLVPEARHTITPEDALRELLRGRMELLGPVTERALIRSLGIDPVRVEVAMLQLEGEGAVMRGQFGEPGVDDANCDAGARTMVAGEPRGCVSASASADTQWCERRLLARIHRLTRDRKRAQVQAVAPAQFLAGLAQWHGIASSNDDDRREGDAALTAILQQLEGWIAPASAWERDILPKRLRGYTPDMLDRLCASGRIVWWRPVSGEATTKRKGGPLRSTPIMLVERAHLGHWQSLALSTPTVPAMAPRQSRLSDLSIEGEPASALSSRAERLLASLRSCGALFFSDLERDVGLLRTELEDALGELVSNGLVACDSFAGLRALIAPATQRARARSRATVDLDNAGRWSLLRPLRAASVGVADSTALADPGTEHVARVLLRRYGVVFRALLAREQHLPTWRELHYVYRRMEARGEIRGGRFVSGYAGEQFALPDAVAMLRKVASGGGRLVAVSAADPLNLVGIVTPGDKVPALGGNRVAFRDGAPVAAQTGGDVRFLQTLDESSAWAVRSELVRRPRTAAVR